MKTADNEQGTTNHETMRKSSGRDERNGWKLLLNTKLNARVLVTLTLALAVVLAGCMSLGGLGGSDGEAGVAEADTRSGGTNDADNGAEGADGASDGADENAGDENNELAQTNIQPREEVWFNASKNGYVFEIYDAENGSGTATFEPPANPANLDEFETVTYEGDAQFEQAYSAMVEDPSVAGMPIYRPLLDVVTILDFDSIDDEDLAVGRENTTSDGSLTTKITGVESYAGVECYATEISVDSERRLETCEVPYSNDVFVHPSQGFPPYMALYDEETGELALEIKLVEIREE